MISNLLQIKKWLLMPLLLFAINVISQTMTLTSNTPVCPGGTGTATVSFTGVTYPFTLNWYNGANVQDGSISITGSPQTITFTGSSGSGNYNGLGASPNFYINNSVYLGNFGVGITHDGIASLTISCSGGTLIVNNIKGGTGPYTVDLIDGKSGSSLVSGASPLSVTYAQGCPAGRGGTQIKISDANGCYVMQDSFYVNCKGLDLKTSNTVASCTNGSATITSVTGGSSPYSYAWNNGATTNSITGLVTGVYSCYVTDVNGCGGEAGIYVAQNPQISVNTTSGPAKCLNADGKATAFITGGTGPYSYLWDNGSTTASVTNLTGDAYHSVKVTDVNGCIGAGGAYITTSTPITVNYNSTPSACTSKTGGAVLTVNGGTTPYTYKWSGLSSTTNTISSVGIGDYSFFIVDAVGCKQHGAVNVPPISQIYANPGKNDAICPNTTGAVYVSASGSSPPLTYLWSSGATTSYISGVPLGSYSCIIKDANQCSVTKYVYVGQVSPIGIGMNSTRSSCIFASDGTATASPYGGKTPYTYKWSNGATTSTISSLKEGYYNLVVTDANGCSGYEYVRVGYNPAGKNCYCEVSGIVYNDLNSNCTQDAGEDVIANVLINTNGGGYAATNDNGYYSIKLPNGSYVIEEIIGANNALASCQSNNISYTATTGSTCTKTLDFANNLTPIHDIQSFLMNRNSPIPGNTYIQEMVTYNQGNTKETAVQTSYSHDGQLSFSASSIPMSVPNSGFPNQYEFTSPITIKPGRYTSSYQYYFTPTNIPLGTEIDFIDSAAYDSPVYTKWITGESTPWNNIYSNTTVVRSSYDPNYKEVYPKGTGIEGLIPLTDKDFRYVIHFENNGTALAQKVVVIDTLSKDFDIETLNIIGASHKVNTTMNDAGVIFFTFDNINLDYTPKGTYNAFAQGWVAYNIKPKSASIKVGTQLKNMAGIYFDYNAPVFTNTAINTYVKNTSKVNTILNRKNGLTIYPNPTGGILNFQLNELFGTTNTVVIYNVQGQVVKTVNVIGNDLQINMDELSPGIYIAMIQSNNGYSESVKFIKE